MGNYLQEREKKIIIHLSIFHYEHCSVCVLFTAWWWWWHCHVLIYLNENEWDKSFLYYFFLLNICGGILLVDSLVYELKIVFRSALSYTKVWTKDSTSGIFHWSKNATTGVSPFGREDGKASKCDWIKWMNEAIANHLEYKR